MRQITAAITDRQRAAIRLRGVFVEWQTRVLGTALAGLSQSEKQFEGIMKFLDGNVLFSGDQKPPLTPEDDLEEVMSGRAAERTARAVPTSKVAGLLGRGFIGGGDV